MFNVGSTSTGCQVLATKPSKAKIQLNQPACCYIGEKVAISRRIEKHWRLIGWGEITDGKRLENISD